MTVIEQSRPKAFDIADYFPPEIIDPKKQAKRVAVLTDAFPRVGQELDSEYAISKHIDFPIRPHYANLAVTRALPRGIPWHDFPVVSDPFFRIGQASSHIYWSWMRNNSVDEPNEILLSSAAQIVFRPTEAGRAGATTAYKCGHFLEKYGYSDTEIAIVGPDHSVTIGTAVDLKRPMLDEMRFRYSYEVNFTAIAMKALRHLGIGERPSQIRNDAPWAGLSYGGSALPGQSEMADPLALQWLFKLRDIGQFEISYAYETLEATKRLEQQSGPFNVVWAVEGQKAPLPCHEDAVLIKHDGFGHSLLVVEGCVDDPAFIEFLQLLEKALKEPWRLYEMPARVVRTLNGAQTGNAARFFALDGTDAGLWRGTGKYAPYAFDPQLARVASNFVELGLVDFDHLQKSVSLSEKGLRLLDLLHPDCEDPDVIVRWMGADGFFKPGMQQSCDDWIMRFFSKMKTRVNEIA
jgi:hypothetical protein